MAKKILDPAFFTQPAEELAKALLGKIICTSVPDLPPVKLRIMETEAYPYMNYATHSTVYKTGNGFEAQNMAGGTIYVHDNNQNPHRGSGFDIVSGNKGQGESVLIRGGILLPSGEPIEGPDMVGRALNMYYEIFNKISLIESDAIYLMEDDYPIAQHAIYTNTRKNVPGPDPVENLDNTVDRKNELRFTLA